LKKKVESAKSVLAKQPTSITKVGEAKTPVRSALSWLYVAPVTKESTKTQRGPKKKAT
jgi:hypothetical protein